MTRNKQRFKALLLLLSFFPGFLVAVSVFYLHATFGDAKLSNYGVLLHKPLQHIDFGDHSRSLWRLCIAMPRRNCDVLCRYQLFLLRQMRLGMGAKSTSLGRAVFYNDRLTWPDDKSLYNGVESLRLDESEFSKLPVHRGIYLLDPSGFLVMAWQSRPDPQLVMKDLDKIMKFY